MDIKVLWCDTPLVTPMPFQKKYMLIRMMTCRWLVDGVEYELEVEDGYLSDGASIPGIVQPIIGSPFDPDLLASAIVHDKMCDLGYNVELMSEIFFQNLKIQGNVSNARAQAMEHAVYIYKQYISK